MSSNDGVREYESCSPGSIGVRQLVLLFSLALLPRITGLVTFKNPDELWGPSVRVLTGDLSAGTSQTLPLVNYLNAASFVPLYAIGRLVGVWQGTADFRAQYFRDPTPFIFAGRFVTACFGALSAPLAVLIAGHLGLTRRSSLIVGCMVALFPINVWLSHVAKPDSGVATAILLVAWSLLRRLDGPPAMGADILVGFAFAFAVSFKQTAIFLVAPLFVGFVALLRLDCGLSWARIARGLLVTLAAFFCAWVPMSIGVLLDIKGFLEWQRLALISVERAPSAIGQQIADVGSLFAGNITGLTAAGLVAWLVAPYVRRDRKFLVLWGSSAFGYVAISAASWPVSAARYYFPFHELAFTLGCVAVLSLVERKGLSRAAGVFLAVAVLACSCVGSVEVVRQGLSIPLPARFSKVIQAIAHPERDKILAEGSFMLGLPMNAAAANEERERTERLAQKYGVKLLELPEEKRQLQDSSAALYHVRAMPFSLGGDLARPSSLSSRLKTIKPFWWPIQYEEWDLDYWTTRGFSIFVVIEGGSLTGTGMLVHNDPIYQSFYEQIEARCELVATLPATRPLFYERTVKVYRLRRLTACRPGQGSRQATVYAGDHAARPGPLATASDSFRLTTGQVQPGLALLERPVERLIDNLGWPWLGRERI